MASFRPSLKTRLISKTERLSSKMSQLRNLSASEQKRSYLANLRRETQVTGFLSPAASTIRRKQRIASEFVKRMIIAFQQYVRKRGVVNLNATNRPASRFRRALTNLIERTKERIVGLARRVIDNQITPSQFKDSLTRILRRTHISSVYLGIRGAANLTGNITELLVAKISRELNLVGQFARWLSDIKDSTDELSATIIDKILRVSGSFANAARSTFSQAEAQLIDDIYNSDEEDVVEEIRILDPGTSSHCDPCISWSGFWSPIGTLPAINTLQCGDNCRCTKQYRVYQQNQPTVEYS